MISHETIHTSHGTVISSHSVNTHDPHSGPHGDLHTNREADVTNAICAVLQEYPASSLPHEGNARAAYLRLLPVLEELFQMPETALKKNSEAWLKKMSQDISNVPFQEISENEVLLKAFVSHMERIGDENGVVRVRSGEQIPKGSYKMVDSATRHQVLSPKSLAGHNKLRYVCL